VARRPIVAGAFALLLASSIARPAAAQTVGPAGGQTAVSTATEVDLARVFAALPAAFERIAARGYAELFRLLETLELFRFEAEIDRFVGRPRELNDTTSYKLSLLPFYIAYPIYQPLVAQMTRLDSVRANRIYTVTPGSVSLVDLRLTPVVTLEQFTGLGRGDDVVRSMVTHFSAREISDLGVFLLSQYPFFPQTDDGWSRTKRRVARAAVPIALGALVTGAAFDAGALAYSAPFLRRGKELELRYYGQFRGLGIHWHPYLRGGVAARAYGFEAAAGFADQVNPTAAEPDRALEFALREGWLNQLVQPLGLDAFFEAAVKRSVGEPSGFVGDRTTARTGFFFKREQAPLLPALAMRGSLEAESNLDRRLHLIGALGLERPNSGITTVLQASLIPAVPGSGLPDDARLNLFFVGSMEPLSKSFADDMIALARQVDEELAGLEGLDKRREDWEQALIARGTAGRTPQEQRAMLAEIEQILVERDERTGRLAAELADYLESRRRVYAILNRGRSADDLHGPLDARALLAASNRVLARLQTLSIELGRTLTPLTALRDRIVGLRREIQELEATDPAGARLALRRQSLATAEGEWETETERVRRYLTVRDQLHAAGVRILTAMGRSELTIFQWDTLGALVRTRIARLAISAPP
jgi:hypothetical protein